MTKDTGNTARPAPSPAKGKTLGMVARILAGILGGSILTREQVVKSLPFMFYLAMLALLYISNSYYAERTVMQSYHLRKEIKELRYAFVTGRSTLMFESKQTEVARRLEPVGVKETRIPPVKLIIPQK
ncbi:MAG: hypothetical protein IH599_10135 [Bacteroidales bacterium]|nr:hypothetical protein [Bacteroidales bacterium]